MSSCATDDQLESLLAENLDRTEAEAIEGHLTDCPRCCEVLDRILRSGEPAGLRLREQAAPARRSEVDQDFLEHVKDQLRHSTDRPPITLPNYEIIERLGQGAMGVVYKARHVSLKRLVALKMMSPGAWSRPDLRQRFQSEVEAVARLQHPNIVQVFEVGQTDDGPYCALELVEGGNLGRLLRGAPQSVAESAQLVALLADATHYAHQQGIIHRDLKPANILVNSKSTGENGESNDPSIWQTLRGRLPASPKIADFGVAKCLGQDAGLTQDGMVIGTPSYMPPEQAGGRHELVGPAADVYSLGAILYELLTGRPPFRAETALDTTVLVVYGEPIAPRKLRASVPRDLETICLKCLEKSPARRYESAGDLAEDLRRFAMGEPIRARPLGALERWAKWAKRRPAVAALIAAVVTVAALGFSGVVWQWRQTVRALDQSQVAHDETKAQLYLNQIAHARQAVVANHVATAERILDETDFPARGWEWQYLKRLCQTSLFTLQSRGSPVQSVAFSQDGRLLASGGGDWYSGRDGDLVVWNAHSGRKMRTLIPHGSTVYGVAFHPDNRRLASASADEKVRLWDVHTGQLLHELTGHRRKVNCIALSPDGRRLVSGASDGTVFLWNVETGREVYHRTNHRFPVWGVAFSPDGSQFASCDRDGIAHLWHSVDGEPIRSFSGLGDFRAVAFHPDGSWLALASYSGQIGVWDLKRQDRQPIVHYTNSGPILSLVFTPNGSLAWSSREGHVKIQDARTGKDRYVLPGHDGWAYSVAMSPDGRRLASGGTDGSVRICDATVDDDLPRFVTDGAELPGLMFEGKDRLLALGGFAHTAAIWDVADGGNPLIMASSPAIPTASAGSPDGSRWAWVAEHKLHVMHRATKKEEWSQGIAAGPVTGLAFSTDSLSIAYGGADGLVRVLEAATGRDTRTIGSHESAVTGVAFHPNGQLLATVGEDGTFCTWDIVTGRVVARFGNLAREGQRDQPLRTNITRITFSPDGRRLAVSNPRRPLEIWDADTGRVVFVLDWDAEGASSAAWSPDGQRLAAALGKRVKTWDATELSPEVRRRATEGSALAWHRREAAFGEGRRDWFSADYHLSKLIEAEPNKADHYSRRAAARACLAEAGRRDIKIAEADSALAIQRDPGNAHMAYQNALLTLVKGDRDRYRSICADMLTRFRTSDDNGVTNEVAWTSALAPAGATDPMLVVKLAERALVRQPGNANYLNTLGVALFRAGQYDAAHKRLGEAATARRPQIDVSDWFFLAMTEHHLNRPEEARRRLDQAVQALERINDFQPSPGAREPLLWHERLELRLFRDEAIALIRGDGLMSR